MLLGRLFSCQTSAGVDTQLGQRSSSSQTDLALSSIHHPSFPSNTACLSGDVRHESPRKSPASILDPPQTPCELLLPPAAFMSTENKVIIVTWTLTHEFITKSSAFYLLFMSKTGRANIFGPISERRLEHFSSTPSGTSKVTFHSLASINSKKKILWLLFKTYTQENRMMSRQQMQRHR